MPLKGYKPTFLHKEKLRQAKLGKFGNLANNWQGGITKTLWGDKNYRNEKRKELRHKKGISKKYMGKYTGFSLTAEYKKLERQKRRTLEKGGGELSIKTIQQVYEDNIKFYGTLTCYLCLQSIPFGKDNLEHKTPLFRGGTNQYNNLAIACHQCNNKKFTKTEEEYRKEIKTNG